MIQPGIIIRGISDWLQAHMLACPSKKLLHIECPGCGLQRSFIALIKGNITDSLILYPALLPIMVMVLYTFLHLRNDYVHGARNIKILQVFVAVVILSFYIYKIINQKLTA